MKKSLSWLTIE